MATTSKITGLDALLKRLENASDDILEDTNAAIADWASNVELVAKSRRPVDLSGITITKVVKPFDAEVTASSGATPYAAYQEFGTGTFAASYVGSLPDEWQALARQFYVNGQGRVRPQPYMYPAAVVARQKFINEIKDILNRI
jgi:HK97 gp10 family phage protein